MSLDLRVHSSTTADALTSMNKRFPVSNNCFLPIVGVTGSGKTTIIVNLFRLLNKIYKYTHIIYVAANYRQDATLKASNLNQVVLEDDLTFEQEEVETKRVYTMSVDKLESVIDFIYSLRERYDKCCDLHKKIAAVRNEIKKIKEPEAKEDLLAKLGQLQKLREMFTPTVDYSKPKVLLAIDDNSGAKAFKVNSESNPTYRIIRDRRHHSTSVLACVHNLKTFYAPFRMHATEFIFTAGLNANTLRDIYDDFGNIFPVINDRVRLSKGNLKHYDIFIRIYEQITGVNPPDLSRKYNFLMVFRTTGELRENFDKVVR